MSKLQIKQENVFHEHHFCMPIGVSLKKLLVSKHVPNGTFKSELSGGAVHSPMYC